jgi:hypothetical protein
LPSRARCRRGSRLTGLLDGGAYAVVASMAVDALLPVGEESTMLYVGALAAGAIAAQVPVLLSWHPATGLEADVAGTRGYVSGSLIGWEIGRRDRRALDAPATATRGARGVSRGGARALSARSP